MLTALHSNGIELSTTELLRYRQLTHLLNLKPGKAHRAALSGGYLSKHKGRGMEFDEARHYQAGDDIRAIDWRVTARTGKTHTKIYREERERPVFILCDLSASMQFGTQLLLKSIQAAHLSALIAWSAVQRGDKLGALLFTANQHRECKPMSRKRAVLSLCHELMQLQNAQHDTEQLSAIAFNDACARARRLVRPGSLVYIISDFATLDTASVQHLAHLGRHSEVKSLMVTDPFEHALPQVAGQRQVSVTDGQQRQTWLLGDTHQQQQYRESREKYLLHTTHLLRDAGIHCQQVSAASPLEEQLDVQAGTKP